MNLFSLAYLIYCVIKIKLNLEMCEDKKWYILDENNYIYIYIYRERERERERRKGRYL